MEAMEYYAIDLLPNATILISGSSTQNSTEPEVLYISSLEFLLNGVGVTAMATFGIIGNTLSTIVLSKPKMRTSVALLLLCLAFCDTTFLVTMILLQGLRALVFEYFFGIGYARDFLDFITVHCNPICQFALTGSYFFTIAITLDRFVAVWWPLKSRHICTWSRARYVAAAVVLLAVAYPLFSNLYLMESTKNMGNRTHNSQLYLNKCRKVKKNAPDIDTPFESNFLSWPYLTTMMLFPFAALIIFNTLIYVKVRQANKTRKTMTSQENTETSYAIICILIVGLFFTCNSALFVMAILIRFYICKYQQWKTVLISVDNILVSVSSSSNFIIYCAIGTRFRVELKKILIGWPGFKHCISVESGKSSSSS